MVIVMSMSTSSSEPPTSILDVHVLISKVVSHVMC